MKLNYYGKDLAPIPQGTYEAWKEFIESEILDLDGQDLDGYWDEGLCKEEVVELIKMETGL